jgi:hypothetical protein
MHVFCDLQPYICTFAGCCDMLVTFPTRKLWSEHEFVQHRVKVSYKCHDCGREFANAEPFTRHFGEYHHLKYNQLQLRAFLSAAASSAPPSWPNEHCPLCLETGWASQRKFTTHVTRHMEEIALASLPRDVGDDCDRSSNDEIESQDAAYDESGEDQGSVQAERDPGSPLRAAVTIPDGWIPSPTSRPTFYSVINGRYEGPVALERARASSATFLCSYCPERFSRKVALTDHQHECKRKAESTSEAKIFTVNPRGTSQESPDSNITRVGTESDMETANLAQAAAAASGMLLSIKRLPQASSLYRLAPQFNTSASQDSPITSKTAEGGSTRPPRPNLPVEPRLFRKIFDSQDNDDVPDT